MIATVLAIYVATVVTALTIIVVGRVKEPAIPQEVLKTRWRQRIARKHHVPNCLSPETSGTVYMILQDVDEGTIELVGRKYHLNQVTGEWAWFDMKPGDMYSRRRYECPRSFAEKSLQARPWCPGSWLLDDFLKNPRREFEAIPEARKLGWSGKDNTHASMWLKADEQTRKLICW